MLHGARLFLAGKVPLVIVSAGKLPWLDYGIPEAHRIRDLLVEWGVEGSAVLLDQGSRNILRAATFETFAPFVVYPILADF